LFLIEPNPEKYIQLAKASFFTMEKPLAWAPLAFSQGKILLRDNEQMICLDLKNP